MPPRLRKTARKSVLRLASSGIKKVSPTSAPIPTQPPPPLFPPLPDSTTDANGTPPSLSQIFEEQKYHGAYLHHIFKNMEKSYGQLQEELERQNAILTHMAKQMDLQGEVLDSLWSKLQDHPPPKDATPENTDDSDPSEDDSEPPCRTKNSTELKSDAGTKYLDVDALSSDGSN